MIETKLATRIGRVAAAIIVASALGACGARKPEDPSGENASDSRKLRAYRYTSITMNDAGVSSFTGGMVRFEYEDYAPPAAPLGVSETAGAETLLFLTFPIGWVGEWHPTPRKQFVFILVGHIEVEVGDGEKREFGPGDVILALDTAGRGHISRTLGSEPAISAAVAIGD
jgi:mannose-6-phosphate isomerase-like protein (cupin superfamily)